MLGHLSYSVFGVDVCSTVNEMLSTLAVSCPHGDVEGSTVQLRGRETNVFCSHFNHQQMETKNTYSRFRVWTNLVSGGDLGSLVKEELEGWQTASSAGPVHCCGLQLKHSHTGLLG